jgi:hypothetical protein
MTAAAILYGASRVRNRFGIKDPRFYGPAGHRGQDYAAEAGEEITAYEQGTVAKLAYSTVLGNVMVVRLNDGLYGGWAHLKPGSRLSLGKPVARDTPLAIVAGSSDSPGSAWAGAHVHTTLSRSIDGIFQGINLDPLPRINFALNHVGANADWSYWEPTGNLAGRVQKALTDEGHYTGKVDQQFGILTRKAVQVALQETGYFIGNVDGRIEGGGCNAIQRLARDKGDYKGQVDSKLGSGSWAGFALALERL